MAKKLYKPLLIESIKAGEDLLQQRFVDFNGKICKSGSKAIGVTDVSIDKDQFVPVGIFGILLVESGGTISTGDEITSDDNGRAVKATDSDAVNGYALDDGTEGTEIRILIR
jgi:hypothetical protein